MCEVRKGRDSEIQDSDIFLGADQCALVAEFAGQERRVKSWFAGGLLDVGHENLKTLSASRKEGTLVKKEEQKRGMRFTMSVLVFLLRAVWNRKGAK